jgi:aminopeptidase N
VLVYLSPRGLPEQSTLEALSSWLDAEAESVDAPTLRYVGEARADLERALEAQRRDAVG